MGCYTALRGWSVALRAPDSKPAHTISCGGPLSLGISKNLSATCFTHCCSSPHFTEGMDQARFGGTHCLQAQHFRGSGIQSHPQLYSKLDAGPSHRDPVGSLLILFCFKGGIWVSVKNPEAGQLIFSARSLLGRRGGVGHGETEKREGALRERKSKREE